MVKNLTMDLKMYEVLPDIIPDNISVLKFKLGVLSSDVSVLIRNRDHFQVVNKTTDENGYLTIQAVRQDSTPSDIPSAWFSRYSGGFYFKFYAGDDPIIIDTVYEGVRLNFYGVDGYGDEYEINLSTGTVTPPEDTGIFDTTFDTTFA